MKKINLTDDNYKKLFIIKSSSIRLGIKDFTVGRSLVRNVDTGEETGCFIYKVELMQVRDLDHRHAIDDGFHSLHALMEELRKHYGNIKKDDSVTIVKFDRDDSEPSEIGYPKYAYHYDAHFRQCHRAGIAELTFKIDSSERLDEFKRILSCRFKSDVVAIVSLSFLHTIGGDE